MIYVNARFLTQHITGVQRFAIELSIRLKELLGDEVRFVAPSNIIDRKVADQLGVVVVGSRQGHLWEQLDLPRYLRNINNPLLLCLCNTAPIFYKNKVVTIHDVAFKAYPQTFSKAFLWGYTFLIPRIISSSKHIITVSDFSKKEIIKYYSVDSDKISIIPGAVSNHFAYRENQSLVHEKYFLAVSSLNYRKNFPSILQAFQLLMKEEDDVRLYIVGDMKSNNFKTLDIENYKKNPRIKFLGRVSDEELCMYYSNAIAFVFASYYEGFGLPPLEAQTCKCPVICSDIEPHHEVVGDSALFCNPFDINDIAEKMREILYADRTNYVRRGLDNIKSFGFENSAEMIINTISKLL